MGRRNAYLKAGAWLSDLRRLHEAGHSDRQVAAALSARLGRRLSPWQVWYWRHQDARVVRRKRSRKWHPPLALPQSRRGRSPRCQRDRERRRHAAGIYQVESGWGHLLPRELRWPETGFGPGHRLRPRECDILSLLRDHGSLTARQLQSLLGRRSLLSGLAEYLPARLCRQGLAELRGYITVAPNRHEAVYALADAARASAQPRQDTGIERRYG